MTNRRVLRRLFGAAAILTAIGAVMLGGLWVLGTANAESPQDLAGLQRTFIVVLVLIGVSAITATGWVLTAPRFTSHAR